MTDHPNTPIVDSEDELDLFGKEALDCATRFQEMMQATKTSFRDITGADMWQKLYYAGVIPNIIEFVFSESKAREREAERRARNIAGKEVEFSHTAVNGDMHLFIDGDHDPDICPECIQPGILVEQLTQKGPNSE